MFVIHSGHACTMVHFLWLPDWKKKKFTYIYIHKRIQQEFLSIPVSPSSVVFTFSVNLVQKQFHPRRIYSFLKYDVFFIHFCANDRHLLEGTKCCYLPGPKKHYRKNMDTEYQNQCRVNDFEMLSNNT